jgi:hypothetical protein
MRLADDRALTDVLLSRFAVRFQDQGNGFDKNGARFFESLTLRIGAG